MNKSDCLRTCTRLFLLCLLASLMGCASGHEKFFKSSVAEIHPSLADYDKFNLVAYSGEPKVNYKQGDSATSRQLMESGFVLLGFSSFNGPTESESSLKNQAKRLGAEVVVATNQYSHTASGALPITTYSPQSYQSSGTVWTGSGGWATYSGTTSGYSTQTNYVPYSIPRYDQTAFYWTRSVRPRILGAIVSDMSAGDHQKLGLNQGVCVFACARESPAWNANILAGDFILSVDGQPVSSQNSFYEQVERSAGRRVLIAVWHDGHQRDVDVTLNPSPKPN